MKYTSSTDKKYKDFDIKIYERHDKTYAVEVSNQFGELIAIWDDQKTFDDAIMTGVNYIDEMLSH